MGLGKVMGEKAVVRFETKEQSVGMGGSKIGRV